MQTHELIGSLKRFQNWRRGKDERTMVEAGLSPDEIGRWIDLAIERIGQLEQQARNIAPNGDLLRRAASHIVNSATWFDRDGDPLFSDEEAAELGRLSVQLLDIADGLKVQKLPPGGYGKAYHSPDLFLPPEDVDVIVELEDGKRMVASHHNGFFTKFHGGPLIDVHKWRYVTREDTIFFKHQNN